MLLKWSVLCTWQKVKKKCYLLPDWDSTETLDGIQTYVSITLEGERMGTLKLDFQISHCFDFCSSLMIHLSDDHLHLVTTIKGFEKYSLHLVEAAIQKSQFTYLL